MRGERTGERREEKRRGEKGRGAGRGRREEMREGGGGEARPGKETGGKEREGRCGGLLEQESSGSFAWPWVALAQKSPEPDQRLRVGLGGREDHTGSLTQPR